MQNLSPFDPVPGAPARGGECDAGDRECELCCLAVEHGYRVVLIATTGGSEYVLVDLAWTGRDCEPLTPLEAPGGLDAIADQLAERVRHMPDTGDPPNPFDRSLYPVRPPSGTTPTP